MSSKILRKELRFIKKFEVSTREFHVEFLKSSNSQNKPIIETGVIVNAPKDIFTENYYIGGILKRCGEDTFKLNLKKQCVYTLSDLRLLPTSSIISYEVKNKKTYIVSFYKEVHIVKTFFNKEKEVFGTFDSDYFYIMKYGDKEFRLNREHAMQIEADMFK